MRQRRRRAVGGSETEASLSSPPGEQQIDVVSNIIKTRRRLDGSKIGVELDDAHLRRQMAGKCGSCFQKRATSGGGGSSLGGAGR